MISVKNISREMTKVISMTTLGAVISSACVIATASTGVNLSLVHKFTGTDGKHPNQLTLTSDGSVYGTTYQGGQFDNGVLFKIDASGTYNIIREFNLNNYGSEGGLPTGWVGIGTDGSIYGTTTRNFIDGLLGSPLHGKIYRLAPNGTVSFLYNTGELGVQAPITKFAFKPDGSVYGAFNISFSIASGSYFKYVPATNTFTLNPIQISGVTAKSLNPGVIVGRDANLYGTFQESASHVTFGTIYKIDTNGIASSLYDFDSQVPALGYVPNTLVNEDNGGNFYGAAYAGGNANLGVIYKLALNADGTRSYSILHHFDAASTSTVNGVVTRAPGEVLPASDGKLYGTNYYGGAYGNGVLYQIDINGVYTVLHDFTLAEGHPRNLVMAANGSFYVPTTDYDVLLTGTTTSPTTNFGAIYKVNLAEINHAPVAVNDAYTLVIKGKTPVTINAPGVLANDTDADGDTLTVLSATQAVPRKILLACGTVALYVDGHFVYTPNGKGVCRSSEQFSYAVTDGKDPSGQATVTLNLVRGKAR